LLPYETSQQQVIRAEMRMLSCPTIFI
jgi:hypothetical protein